MGTHFDSHRQRTRLGVLLGFLSLGIVAVLAMALVLPVRAQQAFSPWPMFHHDPAHTGLSPFDTSANPGMQKWKFATGSGVGSSPAIGTDGTIYVGSYDGNLYAVTSGGAEKWNFSAGLTGGYVGSSPAIGTDGTIYIDFGVPGLLGGSINDHLYALTDNGTSYTLKWEFVTGGGLSGPSSPTIGADGTIYISDNSSLYAVNSDGSEKWAYATPAGADGVSSPAIGPDGTVFVTSWGGYLYAVTDGGENSVTLKWQYAIGTGCCVTLSSPAAGPDGTVYVGSDNNFNLYAINPNGTLKWAFATGYIVDSSPAIGADETIYVGSADDNLYAINPNVTTTCGTLPNTYTCPTRKWAFPTNGYVESSPAIGSDGTIYVGSDDGNLYAVNPNDGSPKWVFPFATGGAVSSSPAIGADGTVYVGSADDNLYAVGGSGTPTATPMGATPSSTPTPNSIATPTPTPTSAGKRPLLLGAWVDGPDTGNVPDSANAIKVFQSESVSNRHLDIINTYVPWKQCDGTGTTFDLVQSGYGLDAIDGNGSEAMVTWTPGSGGKPYCTTPIVTCPSDIAAGSEDSDIEQFAQGVAAYAKPILIRPMHEMNGGGTSSWAIGVKPCKTTNKQFISAWQHMVEVFNQQGATNAQFVWCVNNTNGGSGTFTKAYPGDEYVSYVGIDGYNFGFGVDPLSVWKSFDQVFQKPYRALVGLTSEPILISEWASAGSGSSKAAWIKNAFSELESGRYSQISGLVWFDQKKERNWPIESSTAAEKAYRNAVESIPSP